MRETGSVRITEKDYLDLKKIRELTGIPIVRLIHFAIPLLKNKYDISEE